MDQGGDGNQRVSCINTGSINTSLSLSRTLEYAEAYMVEYCMRRLTHQIDGNEVTLSKTLPEFEDEDPAIVEGGDDEEVQDEVQDEVPDEVPDPVPDPAQDEAQEEVKIETTDQIENQVENDDENEGETNENKAD